MGIFFLYFVNAYTNGIIKENYFKKQTKTSSLFYLNLADFSYQLWMLKTNNAKIENRFDLLCQIVQLQ